MNTHRKRQNLLIYFLTLLVVVLGIFVFLGICQQKAAMEFAITCAKLERKEPHVAFSGKDISKNSLSVIQCQVDGNVDNNVVKIVNQQLALVPAYIQDAFVRNEWGVYVTDINIGQTYYNGKFARVMASTNYEEKRILIESRLDAAYESPIHEVGHWFDLYLGFVTDSPEFTAIYSSESAAFIRSYGSDCVRDEMEFFSEGFWQYVIAPEQLKATSPQLYDFIHENYCLFRIQRTWYEYISIFA